MTLILHIETATKVCSVALSRDGKLLAAKEIADDSFAHGEQLTLLIDGLLKENSVEMQQLNAVSVASGPGSYTGLRIGVSVAKGLCYTLALPLIAVNALESLKYIAAAKYPVSSFLPMIDARRMEVYTAAYAPDGKEIRPVSAEILDETTFTELEPFVFFGDGAAKAAEIWKSRNCTFDSEILSSATGQVVPAYERFLAAAFEDVAYFEPFYLKEFQGTMPKSR